MSVKIGSQYWISIILVVEGSEWMGFQYSHMIFYGWSICIWCWGCCDTASTRSIIFPWPQAGSQEAAEDTDPHKHLTLHWAVIRQAEVTRSCSSSWYWELLKLRNVALLVCNWPQVKKSLPCAMEKATGCDLVAAKMSGEERDASSHLSSGTWELNRSVVCLRVKVHLEGSVSSSGVVYGPSKS